MRALHGPAAGEQPHLSELPAPEVGEGQLLIQVKAAGLNALDSGIPAGMLDPMMPHTYPWCLAGTPSASWRR